MKLIFTLCLLSLYQFLHTTIAYDVSAKRLEAASVRLPSTVRPDHYCIKLYFNSTENEDLFRGEVNITISLIVPVNEVILHAKELRMNEIDLMFGNGSTIKSCDHTLDRETDFLTVKFPEIIPTGKYTLCLKYIGPITNDIGVIRSSYTESDNASVSFIATRLQTIGARRVFPCWDEPSLKANFKIIINHNACFTALSNMHTEKIEDDEVDTKMRTTIFANTPRMSTYSVGFVISRLTYYESSDRIVRVWSRNSTIEKIKYSLEIVSTILGALKHLTNIGYTDMGLEKLDIVVLPKIEKNTESWGLTTIQEDVIIDNADKGNAVEALSHLCLWQWFGNLVSPTWWSDLWFHEGVLDYFGFLMNQHIVGSWRFMDQVIANAGFSSMRKYDSLISAMDIHTMGLQTQNFNVNDVLLYYKPIRIFHMISYVFGGENLLQVWRNYLHDYAFQSSTADDFVEELNAVVGDNRDLVRKIFHNWITTPGFPVITVKRNYTAGTAIISQSRFLKDHDDNSRVIEKYWVPINYASQDNVDFENSTITHWLTPNNESTEVSGLKNDSWIILNKQSFGYYCVNYDIENWNLITKTLKSSNYSVIHMWNRAQMINDAWDLVSIGRLDYGTLLSLIGYLEHETCILPWIAICQRVIFSMEMKLMGTKYYTPFKKYLSKLPNKLIEKIGFEELQDDDYATKRFRFTVLSTTCGWNVSSCNDEAAVKLRKWLDDPERNVIPTALRRTVFCYGIRGGDRKIWETMWKKWIDEQDNEVLYALGCSTDAASINQLLSTTTDVNSDGKMVQMIFDAVRSGSEQGLDIVFEYIIQNWESIKPSYRHNSLRRVVKMISQKDQFDKISEFIESDFGLDNSMKSDLTMILRRLKGRFTNYDTPLPELDDFFSQT